MKSMTPWLLGCALVAGVSLAPSINAQQPAAPKPAVPIQPAPQQQEKTQEELIALRDEKMEAAFLKSAPWITDFDAAKAESKKTGKPIFTYFTRSYAH